MTRDGVVVSTLSAKQRSLLGMLLVHANKVVSLDRLVDGLWGDAPPATAVGVIQTYVSQLRKVLEPRSAKGSSPQVVVRAEPGYRLVVDPDALDANRFERLLAEGRTLLRAGRADVAARRLRDGLELWRGPALADVADAPTVSAEAQRLDDLRVLAMEERVEADIALGRHGELVGELETLVAVHGLRERLWGQLIVCLYRSGRQAEALAAYKRLRRQLNEELGLDPGPDLARLEHDILVHAPELTSSPRTTPTTTAAASSSQREPSSNLPSWSRPEVFVGRLAELGLLEAWWLDPDSPARLALVVGESGIGKTRLATVFARRVEAAGAPVFYGRALEAGGSAYEPVLGALRQFAVGSSDELIDAMSAPAVAALARLVPELAARRPDVAASTAEWGDIDRSWLLSAVADCFNGLSTAPPLLVLDDMQWADRAALLLLSRLIVPETGVRVLATCRHPDGLAGSRFADFLADMRRDDRPVRRIAPAGLSHGDVTDVLTIIGGEELSDEGRGFATALHLRTNGHPLFVRECLLHVDAAAGDGRAWRHGDELERLGIPDGVREIVGQRLSRLAPITREVLRSAAVLGAEFDLDAVSGMSSTHVDEVLGAMEEAMTAGVVWEDREHVDRYRFHHVMVHEVILDALTVSRRARLEWRAGEALEARHHSGRDSDAADIARHFAQGISVGVPVRAMTWARRAGDQALDGLAYEDAMSFYESALSALELSTPEDHATRVDLLIALGRAADRAGAHARCRSACTEASSVALSAGDLHRLGRAAVTLLGTLGPEGDPAIVAPLSEAAEALRLSPATSDQPLLAELLARLSGYLVITSADESHRLAEEALQRARDAGDDRTLALALMYSTQTYALERAEVEQRLHEAARLAEGSGDLELLLTAHSNLMVAGLTWADRTSFDHHLGEYARVAATTRSPVHRLLSIIDHAGAAALDGRYREANDQLTMARRRSDSIDDPFLADNISSAQFGVDRELGLLARHTRRRGESARRPWLHVRAYVLCQTGRFEDARCEFDRAMTQLDVLLAGFTRRRNLAMLAEAALALRDTRAAAVLAARMEPELRYGPCVIVGPNAFFGAVRRYLGLLAQTTGDTTSAVEHHRAALVLHQRMGAAGWAARSHYDLGVAVKARAEPGDEEQANELLAQARRAADHLGMPRLRREVDAVATRS